MKIINNVKVYSYHEFDNLVNLYFPNSNYEVVADNEWNNYEDHLFHITPLSDRDKEPDSFYQKYTKKEMEEFIIGKRTNISVYNILNYLVNESGDLDQGYYLIQVSW